MVKRKNYDVVVIGGGFYGCVLALYYKDRAKHVAVLEKEDDLLTQASYINQARIHNGYHYPRAFVTALRSHINFSRYMVDFKKSVHRDFDHYYAIAANTSKITSGQFVKFCDQIQSPLYVASPAVKKLFNPILIDEIFRVKEYVFDAGALRDQLKNKLKRQDISIFYNCPVTKITCGARGELICHLRSGETITATKVLNCTYAGINELLSHSHLPILPFKYELCEMPLIKLPPELSNFGVTIMDGPFFGVLPFPDRGMHSLWHVRYAVHQNWIGAQAHKMTLSKSNFAFMKRDIQRYIPALSEAVYTDSLQVVKTVLLNTEHSDGRPILYRRDYGFKNLDIIMGGKIDNIYDIIHEIKSHEKRSFSSAGR